MALLARTTSRLLARGPFRRCSGLVRAAQPISDRVSMAGVSEEDPSGLMEALERTSDALLQMLLDTEDLEEHQHSNPRRRQTLAALPIPNVHAVGSTDELVRALEIAGAKGDVPSAEAILAEMHNRGVEPDVYTWTKALGAPAEAGDRDAALSMVRRMCEAGVRTSVQTHTQLLRACCRVRSVRERAECG